MQKTNVLNFKDYAKPANQSFVEDSLENEFEVVLLVDHEETRQVIKTALGYNP